MVIGLLVTLLYFSYQNYVNPKNVYGTWIELNVLESSQEVLRFSKKGVFRNDHLVTTTFNYDGKKIKFSTGQGETIYKISGTKKTPQLKRIKPSKPAQILIREEDAEKVKAAARKGSTLRPKFSLSESLD